MKYMCSPVDRFCELLLTITKAAQELSISRSSMYRLISEDGILKLANHQAGSRLWLRNTNERESRIALMIQE